MNIRVYDALDKAASLDKEAKVGKLTMLGRKLGLLKTPKGGLGFGNLLNNKKVSKAVLEANNLRALRQSQVLSTEALTDSIRRLHNSIRNPKLKTVVDTIDTIPRVTINGYANYGNSALRNSQIINDARYLLSRAPYEAADELISSLPRILDSTRVRSILRDASKAATTMDYHRFSGYLTPDDLGSLMSSIDRADKLRGLTKKQINTLLNSVVDPAKDVMRNYPDAVVSSRAIKDIISKLKQIYK